MFRFGCTAKTPHNYEWLPVETEHVGVAGEIVMHLGDVNYRLPAIANSIRLRPGVNMFQTKGKRVTEWHWWISTGSSKCSYHYVWLNHAKLSLTELWDWVRWVGPRWTIWRPAGPSSSIMCSSSRKPVQAGYGVSQMSGCQSTAMMVHHFND